MSVFTTGKRRRSLKFYRQHHKGGHGHVDRRWPTKRKKPPPPGLWTIHFTFDSSFIGHELQIFLESGATAFDVVGNFDCFYNPTTHQFSKVGQFGFPFTGVIVGFYVADLDVLVDWEPVGLYHGKTVNFAQ